MTASRKPDRVLLLLAVAGAVAVASYLAGLAVGSPALRLAAKPVPVLALAVAVARRGTRPGARWAVAGLLASAAGDVLLELPGSFLPGLIAFLTGHVAYTAAFLRRTRRPAPALAVPFAVWMGGAYAFLWPDLGSLRIPVAAYVGVIGLMMWRASVLARGSEAAAGGRRAAAGAVSFGVSDSLIALDRFHAAIPGVRYPIILLYWAGQLGIAAAWFGEPRGSSPAAGAPPTA